MLLHGCYAISGRLISHLLWFHLLWFHLWPCPRPLAPALLCLCPTFPSGAVLCSAPSTASLCLPCVLVLLGFLAFAPALFARFIALHAGGFAAMPFALPLPAAVATHSMGGLCPAAATPVDLPPLAANEKNAQS